MALKSAKVAQLPVDSQARRRRDGYIVEHADGGYRVAPRIAARPLQRARTAAASLRAGERRVF